MRPTTSLRSCCYAPRPVLILVCVLGLAGGIVSAPQAQANEDLVDANNLLQTGKPQKAIDKLNAAFKAQRLNPRETARALYMRGRARLLTNNRAAAISDLTSALWTKLLPPKLQREAEIQRALAYDSLGIAPAKQSIRRAAQPAPSSKPPTVKPEPQPAYKHKVAQPITPAARLPEGIEQSSNPSLQNRQREQQATKPPPIAGMPAWRTEAQRTASQNHQSAGAIYFGPPKVVTGATQRNRASRPAPRAAIAARPAKPVGGPWQSAAQPATADFTTTTATVQPKRSNNPPKAVPKWSSITQQVAPVNIARPPGQAPGRAWIAPDPQLVAPSPPAVAAQPAPNPAPTSEGEHATSASLFSLPTVPSLFGGSAQKSDAVAAADELQRNRYQRIREHNRRLNAAAGSAQ